VTPFASAFRPQGGVSLIAEPANTHNGSVEYLVELTKAAADAGADSIKYQVFRPDHMSVPDYEWYGVYQQIAIPYERWPDVFAEARARGLAVLAEVFDVEAARFCVEQEVRAFKLNTADTANRPMLEFLRCAASLIFVSVGGSELTEARQLLDQLRKGTAELVLNYGFQNYPTQAAHSHIAKVPLLALHFGLPICFADHVAGDDPLALELPCLAVAAGATSIEKHIVLRRTADRYDYYSSIEPASFAELVARIRQVEVCLGPQSLALDAAEREYREKHKKCPVLKRALPAGHQLTENDVDFKRANGTKEFTALAEVIGRTLLVGLPEHTALRREHVR
jgi:N,N'-diacetyllegionaminate synthase